LRLVTKKLNFSVLGVPVPPPLPLPLLPFVPAVPEPLPPAALPADEPPLLLEPEVPLLVPAVALLLPPVLVDEPPVVDVVPAVLLVVPAVPLEVVSGSSDPPHATTEGAAASASETAVTNLSIGCTTPVRRRADPFETRITSKARDERAAYLQVRSI
jgi:hypothetical protein